jgi:hypothetical protein
MPLPRHALSLLHKSKRLRRRYDALEHHHESPAPPVDRHFGEPLEDRVNLVPDGPPFGTVPGQVELGRHDFEAVDHFEMALRPRIGAALVKEGLDLVHRYPQSSWCLTMAGLFIWLICNVVPPPPLTSLRGPVGVAKVHRPGRRDAIV